MMMKLLPSSEVPWSKILTMPGSLILAAALAS